MLLTKNIKVKINAGNYPRYKGFNELKDIKIGDEIDIPIEYIGKQTNYKVDVKCDVCGKERNILYSTYNTSTKKETEMYVCRGKCANIKREKTNMELYGVKNCFQNEKMKDKAKNTMKEKYGHEYNMQCEKFLDARKETYLENWGVDNPSKNIEIFMKSMKKGLKMKKYKNTNIDFQGSYEKDFLDTYFNRIIIENGPTIKYYYDNNEKSYHSDFFIPSLDLVVEIKSTYWLEKYKNIVEIKEKYTKKHHNYILILDKKYDVFEKIIM